MHRPSSFKEFNAIPATGPTYTDLAREAEALKEDNAALLAVLRLVAEGECDWCRNLASAHAPNCIVDMALRAPHPGQPLLDEMERLKKEVATLQAEKVRIVNWKRVGETGQQAVLDFAHELAEMEPAARDAAIRRIIDNAEETR